MSLTKFEPTLYLRFKMKLTPCFKEKNASKKWMENRWSDKIIHHFLQFEGLNYNFLKLRDQNCTKPISMGLKIQST